MKLLSKLLPLFTFVTVLYINFTFLQIESVGGGEFSLITLEATQAYANPVLEEPGGGGAIFECNYGQVPLYHYWTESGVEQCTDWCNFSYRNMQLCEMGSYWNSCNESYCGNAACTQCTSP